MEKNAVSEVLGYVLAFGIITIMSIFVFYSVYPQAVSLFQESRIKIVETQMSIVDYSTSLCALGDTPAQLVKFNLNGASLKIESGGNWLEIYPVINGSKYNKAIYNGSIGRVIASYDSIVIGYEGGGVWEKRGNGVVMITPPEFHFKTDTLTFPLIKIVGNGSAGGEGTIYLQITKRKTTVYYPNTTTDSNFTNPLTSDYIILKLKSDFYLGWKEYFEERSDAEVEEIYPNNNTIVVKMATKPAPIFRKYQIPIEINRLNYSEEEPIKDFEINFAGMEPNFNLILRTYTDPELVLLLKKTRGGGRNYFQVAIVYGNSSQYESWETTSTISWNLSSDSYTLDFLSEDVNMTYKKPAGFTEPTGFPLSSQPVQPTITWGSDVYRTDSGDFNTATKTMKEVVEHYFRVLAIQTSPDIRLYEDEKASTSGGFNKELTTYRLLYSQIPPIITYLHIAEHETEIRIS